ncbi:hypothetical protein [Photobacterium frigidiphilum]
MFKLELTGMAVFLNQADLTLILTMAKSKVLFKQGEYCIKGTFE